MCHYTYEICVCCNNDKEYDGTCVLSVEYCDNRPVSADGYLHHTDFRDCPSATAECLGLSDFFCHECSQEYFMEYDRDGFNTDKYGMNQFSDESDEE